MHVVQRDLGPLPLTFKAKYVDSGSDGAVAVGYVVCYDVAQPIEHAADDWAENERFKVVTKPKTANLNLVAGVVTDIEHDNDDGTFVVIQSLNRGQVAKAYVDANATVGTTALEVTDDSWNLTTDAATSVEKTAAFAGETDNTTGAAEIKTVFGAF